MLRTLRGLGSYTANAVACFAFGQCVPVVDTAAGRIVVELPEEIAAPAPSPDEAAA